MREITLDTDLCVIGGGMAGVCCAIAAARNGISVVLMQDRPMLGGNASSEIRMWICGAHGENNRETGILEEIELENLYRNTSVSFSVWDSIVYEKVKAEKRITLLLNTVCQEAKASDNRIASVRGYTLTSETYTTVNARFFADCSGDSILAPLLNLDYRQGRESASEWDESIEPTQADRKTMGNSILFQLRETDSPKPFIPPAFAHTYSSDEDLPFRDHDIDNNFWWIELGGDGDSIHDAENLRDELLKIAFGVVDHLKNQAPHGMDNWELDWMGFLPGKRESRRYIGDYTMSQKDVSSGGHFDDLVAYGGWSMDDHHPSGFLYPKYPTIYHDAPSPFGIPYRCLYSNTMENLFFAGRNISVTHAVLSATRVMATCAILGQAIGTAAAIAIAKDLSPRGVYEQAIDQLQEALLSDDAYLPFHQRSIPKLTQGAKLSSSQGDAQALRDGYDRICEHSAGWTGGIGDTVTYAFEQQENISQLRFVFDSDLNRSIKNMPCSFPLVQKNFHVPESLVKSFVVEASCDGNSYTEIVKVENNHQRLVCLECSVQAKFVRFTPLSTWGATAVRVFSWDVS